MQKLLWLQRNLVTAVKTKLLCRFNMLLPALLGMVRVMNFKKLQLLAAPAMPKLWYSLGFLGLVFSTAAHAQTSFAPLVEKLIPSVVNISTERQDNEDEPGVINDLLFAAPDGRVALGSGFVISPDGYIATNRHVIEKASKITVIAADNQEYEAKLIGADSKTDIAVIKISPQTNLIPVIMGESDSIKVGDWIVAIGNPFGLGSSVTAGIISAKARDIDSGPYDNYLQTDASINQGNSGGPMFDLQGKLIGINTAIFSTAGNSVGIGFALPVSQAGWVINQLIEKGRVERSWLGVAVKPGQSADGEKGLMITAFEDEDLALKNGFQLGDIIIEAFGQKTLAAKDFSMQIARMDANEEVPLKIWRDGKMFDLLPKTAQMPSETNLVLPLPEETALRELEDEAETQDTNSYYPQLGLTLNGLIITAVDDQSEAFLKGVKAGDMIRRANKVIVLNPAGLNAQIEDAVLENHALRLELEDNLSHDRYFIDLPVEDAPHMENANSK